MSLRNIWRSSTVTVSALALAAGLLVVTSPEAIAVGSVPYEPGAPIDTFPETNGKPLPSAAALAAEVDPAESVDATTTDAQALPASASATSTVSTGWTAAGRTPVEVRAGRTLENGQAQAAGADALGDTVRVDVTQLNGQATGGGVKSPAMASVGTPTLQIGLQTTTDAKTSGANNDLDVRLPYASFAGVYGGNWADRLTVTAFPACSATTPQVAACQVGVPVPSANDLGSETLSFTATPPLKTGEAVPAAPAPTTLQDCFSEQSTQMSTFATDDRWDGDPTNQDEGLEQDTDTSAVSGDDGNYDDTDAADDNLSDVNDAASLAASSSDSSASEPAPELTAAASDNAACRGLVYQVRAGAGGYAMATAAAAGGSEAVPSTLETSAGWQVGEGSGEFNWSYPFAMPTGLADEAPQLGLSYSSAAVDGMTGPTPAQVSQAGIGWSLDPGHISRTYAACGDDDTSDTSGDLCWRTQGGNLVNDLSLVLEGHATRLIRDAASGKYRLQDDPGWRVETKNGPFGDTWVEDSNTPFPDNADGDDEAFRLTSPDGTRYYFGFGTTSVWTVPVRGNDAGEPCNGQAITSNACKQAWQWNLDRVVDADGNRVKYTYETETNFYKIGPENVVGYDRAGHVQTVQYGFPRSNATESVEPQAGVEFVMAGRCTASIAADPGLGGDFSCTDQNAPRSDATKWPDTPVDLLCGSDPRTCNNTSPAFFSLLRYKRILTHRGKLATAGDPMSGPITDRYVLTHQMPDPDGAGGDEPDLWLDKVEHQPTPQGQSDPATAALPAVQFTGQFLDNLVVPDGGGKQLEKLRLRVIRNELGGRVVVDYGHQRPCQAGDVAGKAAWNTTKDCYAPRRPGGTDDNLTWYHKYLVKTLTLGDQALGLENLPNNDPSLGTIRQYRYTYRGDPGWRYDGASKTTPAKFRSWSDWRGYQTTLVRTMEVDKQSNAGQPKSTAKSIRRVVVYRGMFNSRADNTSALRQDKVATVERGSTSLPDRNALRGKVAEETTLEPPTAADCPGAACVAKWISRTYHGYKIYRSALSNLNMAAYFTGEALTRTHTRVTRQTGSPLRWDRRHTINRTFDPGGSEHRGLALGTETYVLDRGAGTSSDKPGDKNTCTTTAWVGNSDRWIRVPTDVQVKDQTTGSDCNVVRSRVGNFYDDTETQTGTALSRGRLTRVETYTDATNKITTKTGYDKYGRVTSTLDGRGFPTTTTYNQAESGETVDDLPVKITTTNNQSQVVTRLEKRRGLPVSVTDLGDSATATDDARTTTTYDGYGRLLSVRKPNLDSAGGAASVTFDYLVNGAASKPARVKTTTRRDGGVLDTSYAFMDGWGRTIETQTPQADGNGRVVSATGYNELGQAYLSMPVIANADAPGSDLLNADPAKVERHELTTYDAASRVTRVWHMAKNNVQKYSTISIPQGDRTITTQPVVGATVDFFDGWGRTWKVQQYSNNTVDVAANREHSATYTYDGNNNLTGISSTLHGIGQQWTYGYDFAGRRVSTSDPDTGTSTSTYDANSNQVTTTTPADGTLKTVYDNQDRPTKRFKVLSGTPTDCADPPATPSGCTPIAKWTYDSATRGDGRLASSISYTSLGTYTDAVTGYDLNGNVLGETYTYPDNIAGTPSGTTTLSKSWTYNDADMVKTANYGALANLTATTVATTYGVNGQVNTMTATQAGQPNVKLLQATYDKVGQPLRALSETSNTAKHLNREYAWDNATGRLTRVGGSAFGTLDYTYDVIGNPTSVTEHNVYSDSPEDPTAAWCYTYEPLNRLKTAKTGATASNGCATPAANTSLIGANQDLTYYYSADRMVGIISYTNGVGTNRDYTYSTSKPHQTTQITGGSTADPALPPTSSLTYDAAGRIKTLTPTSGAATTYSYNPTGSLQTSTLSGTGGIASSYAYDTNGVRVARRDIVSGTGGYNNSIRYFGDSELTVKTPTGGATVANGRRIFTTPGGKPLAIQAGTGTSTAPAAPIWTLQLGDAQDSLRFTRNQTAGTDARPTYRPFGQAISASTNGERGYLNKPQDPNGDLRLDQRNYQPQLNVLTTPDEVFDKSNPQTLNPYAYALNNPISLQDPSGLEPRPLEDDGCASAFDDCTVGENIVNSVADATSELFGSGDSEDASTVQGVCGPVGCVPGANELGDVLLPGFTGLLRTLTFGGLHYKDNGRHVAEGQGYGDARRRGGTIPQFLSRDGAGFLRTIAYSKYFRRGARSAAVLFAAISMRGYMKEGDGVSSAALKSATVFGLAWGGAAGGSAVGTWAGSFGGPAAPVTVPLGTFIGGGLGGIGGGYVGQQVVDRADPVYDYVGDHIDHVVSEGLSNFTSPTLPIDLPGPSL